MAPFRIYIGWDKREPEAYDVARASLKQRASIPLEIAPIKLDELERQGHYWRSDDPLASTEFTYSRFLTPFLAGYRGAALFCDCDFLWLADVAELLDAAQPGKAVHCVQHDYRPTETTKMDGRGADRLSAQELVVADAVRLRASGRAQAHARGRER